MTSVKDAIIKSLADENRKMHDRIIKLESNLKEVERQIWSNEQYSRRNNIELQGLPDSVPHSELEDKIIEVFSAIDVHVQSDQIEACHRLPSKSSPQPVIIKFVNRKNCDLIMANKKKFTSCDKTSLGFDESVKFYVCDNLSPANKRISWKCRQLKRANKISSTWSQNGVVHIRVVDGERYKKITHNSDLESMFPDFEFIKEKERRVTP